MKPPRMRISVLGGDAAFEHELGVVGHQVVRSFRDIDMFLIAETIPKNVVKAAETLPSV